MSSGNRPEGWSKATLEELGDWGSGGTPLRSRPEYFSGGTIPWLKIGDLNDGVVTHAAEAITDLGLRSSAAKLLPKDVLLLAMYGSIGKLGITGIPCATNQAIAFCRPHSDRADLKFLFWLLRSEREALLGLGKGGTQQNISQTVLRASEVPVPPLLEQRRIVARVEELLAHVNAARERLVNTPAFLRRFREAVLSAACDGRLTAGWRERHVNAGSGAELIGRIKKEHEQYGAGRSNAAPPSEEAHDLDATDLPGTWAVGKLAGLCEPGRPITYGILKPGPHEPDGVPYVRVADFPRDQISDLAGLKRTSRKIARDYQRATLRTGDVLLAIRGTYGRVCRVPMELSGGNITQDTARLTVHPQMNADYIAWNLRGPSAQDRMRRAAKGVAVHGINIGDVRAMQIPVPPADEQAEIVRRVVALFKLADTIEGRVVAATMRADRLTKAILAKAFRGELVPTEAELTRKAPAAGRAPGKPAGGPRRGGA